MKLLRIIIITSFFEEKYGYQEVHLANTLSKMGHEILILTSNRSPFSKERLNTETSKAYNVIRLNRNIRVVDTLFPLKPMRRHIKNFDPEIALVVHIGHGIPYYSMKYLDDHVRKVTFFGDLRRQHASPRRRIIQTFLKNRWYYKSFKMSNLIIANTNETVDILSEKARFNEKLTSKLYRSSLGFDSSKFFLDVENRKKNRIKFGFPENSVVFCTTTKIVKRKPIIEWIHPILDVLRENENVFYCLAGFLDDDHSRSVEQKIKKIYNGDNLKLLPLLSFQELNDLYNASDYSVWFDASITIQESMGTGLKVIIPNSKRVNHLVENDNGFLYNDLQEIHELIIKLSANYDRESIAAKNKRLSYNELIIDIINKVSATEN